MTDKRPFISISVVIPAYNAEAYIERAIESVLAQTYAPDEILVVDNGSTDRTAEKIRQYEPKVQYLFEAKAGPGTARNRGIRAAGGDWIAFLDSDDQWFSEKLQKQVEHLCRHPELVWTFTNYLIFWWDKGYEEPAFPEERFAALLKGRDFFDDYLEAYAQMGHILTSSVMIQRAVLLEAGLFPEGQTWAEDTDLFFRIAYQRPAVGYLSQPLLRYYSGLPTSLTEQHRGEVKPRCELIERHLSLAAQYHRQGAFEPCARQMLNVCIGRALAVNPCQDFREIPEHLEYLLPARLRREIRLRKRLPRAILPAIALYFRIKNTLRNFFARKPAK